MKEITNMAASVLIRKSSRNCRPFAISQQQSSNTMEQYDVRYGNNMASDMVTREQKLMIRDVQAKLNKSTSAFKGNCT